MSPLRICFVGLKCYDHLSGAKVPRFLGGIEAQEALLAQGLAQQGFSVALITYDHGQPDAEKHTGITLFKAFAPQAGIGGLRFIHPRWTGLATALRRANADVYYQMGAGCETGQTALWCRTHRRPFVFATASDGDCLRNLPMMPSWKERCLYRWGLKRADLVIAQTQEQQRLLHEQFGLESTILPGCCRAPQVDGRPLCRVAGNGPPRVLWVGRIEEVKRPHLVLETARQLPECAFDVVGESNRDTAYAREFREQAARCPNVTLHGKVPNERVADFYRTCTLLVCTSRTEGFPVTFLEAWSHGVPVVSTFDPDGVIVRGGLGVVGGDAQAMADAIKGMCFSPARWTTYSQAARRHYLANHTIEAVAARLKSIFSNVMSTAYASGVEGRNK